jgi:cytochrome c oxidase assembly protein subunit 15
LLLLIAGALVTSNNAGLSVPDWPLSYGSFFPPMVGGIFYEHGHRVIATAIGILTIILAVLISRHESRRWVRRLGWTALALIIVQGLFGGLTVKLLLPPPISTIHATLAQLFFVTIVSLTLFTSPWWARDHAQLDDAGSPEIRVLALWTSIAIFVQLILGAGFRHGAWGIIPHLVGAGVVLFLVIWTGRTVRKRFGAVRDLRRWGILLQAFMGTQILLGIAAYWAIAKSADSVQPANLYVALTVAHVLVGALTLGAALVLTLCLYRLVRPRARVTVKSPAVHSQS